VGFELAIPLISSGVPSKSLGGVPEYVSSDKNTEDAYDGPDDHPVVEGVH